MKNRQELNHRLSQEENININNIITQPDRSSAKKFVSSRKNNIERVKTRLDNLGEHVQELFSEFKTALNHNKRPNSVLPFRNQRTPSRSNITVSSQKCNKLLEKFEKIQKEIKNEKLDLKKLHKRSKSRKSSKKRKKKPIVKGVGITLLERNQD